MRLILCIHGALDASVNTGLPRSIKVSRLDFLNIQEFMPLIRIL